MSKISNDKFNRKKGFELGRPRVVFGVWNIFKILIFLSPWPWPSSIKTIILKLFGAKVGKNVYWKPRINIHIPWKLSVGDSTWVGEEVCIINFDHVKIGSNCCISQRTTLCSGSHDYKSFDMAYRNSPIDIQDGVWIGAHCFVGPGVLIGTDAVVTAASMVNRSLPGGSVCAGNPCRPVRQRWL
jgi:putative colanic acid biosynthesis acetyltransferase WcaF